MTHLTIRELGFRDYLPVWEEMKQFTLERDHNTPDQIWIVEHPPVFTQGQAGKAEHILNTGDIPVIPIDRGGQVTYHGPGQLIAYFLIDLQRGKIGVRDLVCRLEKSIIDYLATLNIDAHGRRDAPGVYVDEEKICSIGLRVKRKGSYHGLAFNINMDLEPFSRINPCGMRNLKITQLADLGGPSTLQQVTQPLIEHFKNILR